MASGERELKNALDGTPRILQRGGKRLKIQGMHFALLQRSAKNAKE
jgi:hypothetical protein